jgi:hypothetical protein
MAQFAVSRNGVGVIEEPVPVTPPAKCPSPWAMAIGTSIAGALAVWALEAVVNSMRGKKR